MRKEEHTFDPLVDVGVAEGVVEGVDGREEVGVAGTGVVGMDGVEEVGGGVSEGVVVVASSSASPPPAFFLNCCFLLDLNSIFFLLISKNITNKNKV